MTLNRDKLNEIAQPRSQEEVEAAKRRKKQRKNKIIAMTKQEFLEAHPTGFVGFIKVGNRGVPEFYTDVNKYNARLDRAWDSGFDMECSILRKE